MTSSQLMQNENVPLPAASSQRWLACPPSALLCAEASDEANQYAEEGTSAHMLCEYKLKTALGMEADNPSEDLTYFNAEMNECSDEYTDFVMAKYMALREKCEKTRVLVEAELDFSRWVNGGAGTGDCVILSDGQVTLIDYKHGAGVVVSAKNNPQLMCYALGVLSAYDGIYDIQSVELNIFQPRRENISTWSITKEELLTWAEDTLKPRAELAAKGEGEFFAGEHCRFCTVRANCRRRAEYNMALATYDFQMPNTLTDTEIEAILARADSLVSWVRDVREYALVEAIGGKLWHGWKVVEGRSVRKYTSERDVALIVRDAGYDPYEIKVLGITAMTKMLGKKKFDELLGEYLQKPPGKPALVPDTDPRKLKNSAEEDFKTVNAD